MKNGFAWMGAAVAALSILGTSSAALASSHREAPAISMDPAADNTDLWAWNSGGNLHIVACYNPLEEPSGGPNFHKFADDVLYEIHVARGDASLADVVTYQIQFTTTPGPTDPTAAALPGDTAAPLVSGAQFFSQISGASQTYTVTAVAADGTKTVLTSAPVKVAPPNIGPRTDSLVYGGGVAGQSNPSYTNDPDTFVASFFGTLSNGGKVFAGPRDDGFYVDLGGIFDLANLRTAGTAQDGVAGFNTHAISLDIPDSAIPAGTGTDANKDIAGIWASASRRKVRVLRADGSTAGYGPWVQVSRLGFPLVNEALIGLQDKDKYNRTQPATDVANFAGYFLTPIVVQDAAAVGVYGNDGAGHNNPPPDGTATGRVDLINAVNAGHTGGGFSDASFSAVGDVLRVNLAATAAEGFPAGRALPDDGTATNKEPADVTDVVLNLVLSPPSSAPAGLGVADGVNHNDANYPSKFPYLANPWQGFGEGHGKTAN